MASALKVRYTDKRKDLKGEQIREFSHAVHGESFQALAEEFAKTNNGVIIEPEATKLDTAEEEPAKAKKAKKAE